MIEIEFAAAALNLPHQTLLSNLDGSTFPLRDKLGNGILLRFRGEKPAARHVFKVGALPNLQRFTACHRYEPFWMNPAAGTLVSEIPVETQFLLLQCDESTFVALIPLLDGAFRAYLQGNEQNQLEIVVESGDPAVITQESTALFVAADNDPFRLMKNAARSVREHLNTGRLREEKAVPEFVDQFGWCTWDAFYREVSQDKVRLGLESFVAGGVSPRLLILDDGWQTEEEQPTGERRLVSLEANQKFGGDLSPTVQMAKKEFGVQTFLVWHAMNGYWGGVDPEKLPHYNSRMVARSFGPGILHHSPTINDWFGGLVGVVPPENIHQFFHDYHRRLRQYGVDGVKVDSQSTLEGVAASFGGRVALMQGYHEALEGAVQTHFLGNIINCMSCSNDMLYSALNSNVTRTSTDFWPDKPESHGLHLYCNAQVSMWFGEFIFPDWDMFQSGHEMGAYHAAGRALSGGPVYVSDKPGLHNFDLLRQLVLPDGSILRAQSIGRPTRDCLFFDPTKDDVLLKIWNTNEDSGIIGAFNARYSEDAEQAITLSGSICPADVESLRGEQFAVYALNSGEMRILQRNEAWEITLPQLQCEVFTIVPIQDGVAAIGMTNMFNSGGAIVTQVFSPENTYQAILRCGGRFLAWCERAPQQIEIDTEIHEFAFDASTGILEILIESEEICSLLIRF
jgi:raffinose synthase